MALLVHDAQHSAPDLNSGLIHRNWCDRNDYDAMARVLVAVREAEGLPEARTGEDLERMYARTKNFVATRDVFLVESDKQVIAYATCQWWSEASGKWIHRQQIEVLPVWQECGIEDELLARLEAHQRNLFVEHMASGLGWFEIEIQDSQTWLKRLATAKGYERVRGFDIMLRDTLANVPDAPMPAGIETRPVARGQLEQIFWGGEEAFSEHWSSPVPDALDLKLWSQQDHDISLWQIAWDGNEFVGMVRNFVDDSENRKYGYLRGYTEEIAVRREWRKRGVGRALVTRSLQMFRDMGYDSAMLAVDPDNPTSAQHLYASLGFKTIRRAHFYRKPM